MQATASQKDDDMQALIAEASNLREAVHRLQLDKETSDTLMHGVLAMAGRDEAARKALEEDKGKLVIQLGYEQVRALQVKQHGSVAPIAHLPVFVFVCAQVLRRAAADKVDKEAQQNRQEAQQLREQLELALLFNSGNASPSMCDLAIHPFPFCPQQLQRKSFVWLRGSERLHPQLLPPLKGIVANWSSRYPETAFVVQLLVVNPVL